MHRLCERALNFFQICDENGSARLCSWTIDGYLGKLTEHSIYDLYNSPQANAIKERHIKGDYSLCKPDACPYIAMNDIENHRIEVDKLPELPDSLYIGFERVCNYSCITCTLKNTMCENAGKNLEENYRIIEERIREVLPKIKTISANGCGELFASKHTLKLLSEWEPEAPDSECSVQLETNGSLFNEKNWKQIENLGKYNLRVAISIMSFDEPIYQYLSGTTLPISNLIDNLHFVKKLREEGVINYLEIATVVQEQNFREMPEFARRSIEEFGADYVRLRPYAWWGECSKTEAWFKDVRNPHHPLYSEYKKVMSHPIIKHEKVHDWSGGRDSEWASLDPERLQTLKLEVVTYLATNIDEVHSMLANNFENATSYYIYGLSNAGMVLARILKDRGIQIEGFVDRKNHGGSWQGIRVFSMEEEKYLDHDLPIIVTPIERAENIRETLKNKGWEKTVLLRELVSYDRLKEQLCDI